MRKLSTALVMLLCAGSLQCQDLKEGKQITDWRLLAHAPELAGQPEMMAYYAPDSIRRGQDYTKLWIRWDFPKGSGSYLSPAWRGPEIGSARGFVTLSCDKGLFAGGSMLLYGLDRRLLFEKKLTEVAVERPGSIGQLVLDSFCEREKSVVLDSPPKLKSRP